MICEGQRAGRAYRAEQVPLAHRTAGIVGPDQIPVLVVVEDRFVPDIAVLGIGDADEDPPFVIDSPPVLSFSEPPRPV